MTLDVVTINAVFFVTFAIFAGVTQRLAGMLRQIGALRIWAAGFLSMSLAFATLLVSQLAHVPGLFVLAGAFNVAYRGLIWAGVRSLAGEDAKLRTGATVIAIFALIYAALELCGMPRVAISVFVAVCSLTPRVGLLWELGIRHPRPLGTGRLIVGVATLILCANPVFPAVMAWIDRPSYSVLIGDAPAIVSTSMSIWYLFVFAADLLTVVGLLVLAVQRAMIEQGSLARLEREMERAGAPFSLPVAATTTTSPRNGASVARSRLLRHSVD